MGLILSKLYALSHHLQPPAKVIILQTSITLPQLNSTHSTWRKVHRPELKLTTASLHKFIRQLNATLIALRYRHVLFAECSYFLYLFCKKSVQQLSMSSRESKTKRCFAFVYFQWFPKSTRCPIFMIFPGLGTLLKLITSCASRSIMRFLLKMLL
jgi:hypothetical protein